MSSLIRFGVSIERALIAKFDQLIRRSGYSNRSEAIRDLIRNNLVESEWRKGGVIAGGIGFVYDHHKRALVDTLMDIQHDFRLLIISTQHIHLDQDNCMELVTVKGRAAEVEKLFNAIKTVKGVKHAGIVRTTTGRGVD